MTMDEKIARINALAHKAKAEGLTDEEKEEQAQLRRDYIDSVKANLKSQLNTLYVLDEKTGKKTKIVDFERERAATRMAAAHEARRDSRPSARLVRMIGTRAPMTSPADWAPAR